MGVFLEHSAYSRINNEYNYKCFFSNMAEKQFLNVTICSVTKQSTQEHKDYYGLCKYSKLEYQVTYITDLISTIIKRIYLNKVKS